MNKDLKIIKKYYGEKMAQLCRKLFPSILEQEGKLSIVMLSKFGATHSLYDDIIDDELEEEFKDYIYKFYNVETTTTETNKSVKELLEEAGYDFYECHSEEEIQAFKKYYAPGEALCTFNGNRLNRCYVFWAVKKDVDDIKREDFLEPTRQDRYGTSVISIQFARGSSNTLSIKNRYNHKVNNPDATFSNNLDNIIPGLTEAFEREYGLNITQSSLDDFELRNYVMANDGRLYRYNYEINNIYYCENNVIIDNNEVKQLDKSRYLLIDYFIIDLKEKNIKLYDNSIKDSFIDIFKDNLIDKIEINKQSDNSKIIKIYDNIQTPVIIKIDKYGIIKELTDENITEIGNRFLEYNKNLSKIDLPNIKTIGSEFLPGNIFLSEISFPNLEEVDDIFICSNKMIEKTNLPKLKKIGSLFLVRNRRIEEIDLRELEEVGDSFLASNTKLRKLYLPKLKKVGEGFLINNKELEELELPELEVIEDYFLVDNEKIKRLFLPKLIKMSDVFLKNNKELEELELPELKEVGTYFISKNKNIKRIKLAKLKKVKDSFLELNECLEELELPELEHVGNYFISANKNIKRVCLPKLKKVGHCFLSSNRELEEVELKELEELESCFLMDNEKLKKISLPKLKKSNTKFLMFNKELEELDLPELEEAGDNFMDYNEKLKKAYLPKLKKIGSSFLSKLRDKKHNQTDIIENNGGIKR